MAQARSDYAWSLRAMIIFAPDTDDPRLARQRDLLAGFADAMRERDMVVLEVSARNVRSRYGPPPAASAAELRGTSAVAADEFAVLLIGKDTGVKLRSSEVVAPDTLFSLIDAMAMRRREMEQSGGPS